MTTPATPTTPASAPAAVARPPMQQLSPERLDQVIETTTPRGWWALITIVAALAVVVLWSIFATIPRQTTGEGIVSSYDYMSQVSAPAAGIVTMSSPLGAPVSAGEQIGTIVPPAGSSEVPVLASATGTLEEILHQNGAGVVAGQELATIQIEPDLAAGLNVVTFLPASEAITFRPGQNAQVTLTNLATGDTTGGSATVVSVASSPASLEAMTVQGGTLSVAESWMSNADGAPYRVLLTVTGLTGMSGADVPQAGQPVQITNVYGSVRPIQLLFGSG